MGVPGQPLSKELDHGLGGSSAGVGELIPTIGVLRAQFISLPCWPVWVKGISRIASA